MGGRSFNITSGAFRDPLLHMHLHPFQGTALSVLYQGGVSCLQEADSAHGGGILAGEGECCLQG